MALSRQAERVIAQVCAGGSALVLMPTGAAELCYQVPRALSAGCGAGDLAADCLMRDQVEALRQLGVRAVVYNLDAAQR